MAKIKLPKINFIDLLTKKAPKLAGKAAKLVASVATGGKSDQVLNLFKKDVENSTELSQEDKEIVLAQMESDLSAFELEVKDTANARASEIARLQTAKNPITRNINTWLAVTIILGAFGLVATLITVDDIGATAQTLVNVAFGAIFTAFTTVTGYYFGRSKKEDDK